MIDTTADERAIRDLIAAWHTAAQAGDVERVLTMMADDAVFLTPGRPPIRGRAEFARLQRSVGNEFRFQSVADVQEVLVHDGWAHTWAQLSVTMFPVAGGAPIRRSGPTLTIFRKQPDGSWLLARDANMLTVQS